MSKKPPPAKFECGLSKGKTKELEGILKQSKATQRKLSDTFLAFGQEDEVTLAQNFKAAKTKYSSIVKLELQLVKMIEQIEDLLDKIFQYRGPDYNLLTEPDEERRARKQAHYKEEMARRKKLKTKLSGARSNMEKVNACSAELARMHAWLKAEQADDKEELQSLKAQYTRLLQESFSMDLSCVDEDSLSSRRGSQCSNSPRDKQEAVQELMDTLEIKPSGRNAANAAPAMDESCLKRLYEELKRRSGINWKALGETFMEFMKRLFSTSVSSDQNEFFGELKRALRIVQEDAEVQNNLYRSIDASSNLDKMMTITGNANRAAVANARSAARNPEEEARYADRVQHFADELKISLQEALTEQTYKSGAWSPGAAAASKLMDAVRSKNSYKSKPVVRTKLSDKELKALYDHVNNSRGVQMERVGTTLKQFKEKLAKEGSSKEEDRRQFEALITEVSKVHAADREEVSRSAAECGFDYRERLVEDTDEVILRTLLAGTLRYHFCPRPEGGTAPQTPEARMEDYQRRTFEIISSRRDFDPSVLGKNQPEFQRNLKEARTGKLFGFLKSLNALLRKLTEENLMTRMLGIKARQAAYLQCMVQNQPTEEDVKTSADLHRRFRDSASVSERNAALTLDLLKSTLPGQVLLSLEKSTMEYLPHMLTGEAAEDLQSTSSLELRFCKDQSCNGACCDVLTDEDIHLFENAKTREIAMSYKLTNSLQRNATLHKIHRDKIKDRKVSEFCRITATVFVPNFDEERDRSKILQVFPHSEVKLSHEKFQNILFINPAKLDTRGDKVFDCEPKKQERGGVVYHRPGRPWRRIGFRVDSYSDLGEDRFWLDRGPSGWEVGFHGTDQAGAKGIVQDGNIAPGGRNLFAGDVDTNPRSNYRGLKCDRGAYFADKIDVAKNYAFPCETDGKRYRFVFQARLKPAETRYPTGKPDYRIINNPSEHCRIYGLLYTEEDSGKGRGKMT